MTNHIRWHFANTSPFIASNDPEYLTRTQKERIRSAGKTRVALFLALATAACATFLCGEAKSATVSIETPSNGNIFTQCVLREDHPAYIVFVCNKAEDMGNTRIAQSPAVAKYGSAFVFLPDGYFAYTKECFQLAAPNRVAAHNTQLICDGE